MNTMPMLRIDQNEALYQLVRLEMQSRQQIMPDTNYRSEAMQVLCDREYSRFAGCPRGMPGI